MSDEAKALWLRITAGVVLPLGLLAVFRPEGTALAVAVVAWMLWMLAWVYEG